MGKTTAETIMELTRKHLTEDNGLLLGQCVSAVGWIGGTVPDCEGIVEIPMTDVAGSGFACGAALMGRRPIFVMRYQGFIWYNCSSLINYAGRSKQVWGKPCPVFIRCLGMEGNGVGHTASSCLHSIFMHVPGIPVAAPVTPGEYREVWNYFMSHDDPIYVSEHRKSYGLTEEYRPRISATARLTAIGISGARMNLVSAAETLAKTNTDIDVFHALWLKPYEPTAELLASLKRTGKGLVIDSDFSICGAAEHIAYTLMLRTGVPVHVLGLKDKVCGVAKELENITPSADEIAVRVAEII